MASKKQFAAIYSFFGGDELQASVVIDKYLVRKHEDGNFLESSIEEIIDRVCRALSKKTKNSKYWYREFKEAISGFRGVCPQGSILAAAGNTECLQSLSNCFVTASPEDSMSSIFKAGLQEACVMKHRGGDGMSLDKLRPQGSPVSNAARTSSGAVGFADFFSNICRSIAQSGRRGALMLTLDIKHPDALAWAEMKLDPNYCTGANVSLKLSDEFMQAVKNKETFIQQWPVDSETPRIVKEVDARKLWNKICKCAWERAEPGILMWDNIKKMLPAERYKQFKCNSTNPCSEIPLSVFDSCRLISICLTKYVKKKFQTEAYFDFEEFEKDARTAMHMLDAVVDLEIEHIDKILKKLEKERKSIKDSTHEIDFEIQLWSNIKKAAEDGRRTGLGTHGLADCLAQLCIKYDTDQAQHMADRIYGSLCHNAYDESVNMAIEKGPFPVWDWEVEKDCPFFKHFPSWLLDKMKKHGRRNIAILTNAPTGSISMLSGSSSGIEPTFRLCSVRRRKINPNDVNTEVHSTDLKGDSWHHYVTFDKNAELYLTCNNIDVPPTLTEPEALALLPDYFITADKISWSKRVDLQSTIQKYIDHSISSTINLPKDVSVSVVKNIYMRAWEAGLKGVTVYREGCRDGVILAQEDENSNRPAEVIRHEAPQRPEILRAELNPVMVNGEEYIVIIGFLGSNVYEVFAGKHNNAIPYVRQSGKIRKASRKRYYFDYEIDGEEYEVDINEYFENPDYAAITRLVSTSLRHGTPIEFIIDQLQKSSEALVGFEKVLARVLKKYATEEGLARTIRFCEKCQSVNIEVRFQEGCATVTCLDCNTVDAKCT